MLAFRKLHVEPLQTLVKASDRLVFADTAVTL